jgi:hypothetical protein
MRTIFLASLLILFSATQAQKKKLVALSNEPLKTEIIKMLDGGYEQ